MPAPREAIVALCDKLIPETNTRSAYLHWTQIGFDHIAKDYGQGSGTTCGFLPHWLLWRFGCGETALVNRSSPPDGTTYRIGANLSIFQPGKQTPRPSWVSADTAQATRDLAEGRGARPGDFIIIRGANWRDKTTGERTLDSAHIFVLLKVLEATGKRVRWRVAQSGVSNDAMQQGAQITVLTGELREGDMPYGTGTKPGPHLVFTTNILNEEPNFPRRVIGYTNLDALPFGTPPSPGFLRLFEDRWQTGTTNAAASIQPWLGFYDMSDPGGFMPLHVPRLLLHRGHEAFRITRTLGSYGCAARGRWLLSGSRVDVEWEDGAPSQAWTMTRSYVPKFSVTGAALTKHTGNLVQTLALTPSLPKGPPDMSGAWRVC